MKTMQKYAFLFAVAAMGFTACSKEEIDEVRNEPTFTLSIEASADETRSSFGELTNNAYLSSWSGTETVCFYLGTTGSTATPSAAGPSATFNVTFTGTVPASGTIYALSPVGKYSSDVSSIKGGFTSSSPRSDESSFVVIPAVQTPLAGSCDESVHLLAAAQEFTGSIESPLKMHFSHAAAYGRMKITGFTGKIKSVAITSPVEIVGNSCHYKYKEGVFENVTDKTLTINADNVVDNVFWFGCAPAELKGEMTVTVTDDADKRYVKTIPLSTDKHINFTQGRIASFSVNMTGIEAEAEPTYITANLSADEITNQFGVHAYGGQETSYTDTQDGIVWSFNGYKAATSNYLQIKKDSPSYVAIDANGANIKEITVNITDASDKTYTNTLNVKTSSSSSNNVATGKDDDSDKIITIPINGDYSKLYLMSSSGAARIRSIDVKIEANGASDKPSIVANNISDVSARGVIDAVLDCTIVNPVSGTKLAATCDGTVVTNVSADDTNKVLYSVAANSGAARNGKITLTYGDITKEITVSQLAPVFSVSHNEVTLAAAAESHTSITVTSDNDWIVDESDEALAAKGFSVSPNTYQYSDGGKQTVTITALNANDSESGTVTLGTFTIVNADTSDTIVVTVKQAGKSSGGGDTKGIFESMTCFLPTSDDKTNRAYTCKVNDIAGLKLGTGSYAGVFTSSAVGVSGNATFSFYAVAWSGKSAKLYVAVDGHIVDSFTLNANAGATKNTPFTMTLSDDTDYYSINLSGLTATSKITLSTSESLTAASDANSGRAVICGMQLR